MPQEEITIVNKILCALYIAGEALPIFRPHTVWRHRALHGTEYKSFRSTVYNLKKRGIITITRKKDKSFACLTKKGQLAVLLTKADIKKPQSWDGKWRVVMFDIPEEVKEKRDQLRALIKRNNFFKFQASVHIHPYPFNREALSYL